MSVFSWAPGGAFEKRLLHARDEKAANTGGGTFTAAGWRTRDLNALPTNNINGASLAANAVTVPAGDYFAIARCPGYKVALHKTRLVGSIAGTLLVGSSEDCFNNDAIQTISEIWGRFNVPVQQALTLEHQSVATRVTDGFGRAVNVAEVEVYSELLLWRVG